MCSLLLTLHMLIMISHFIISLSFEKPQVVLAFFFSFGNVVVRLHLVNLSKSM
ncbi:hypothetical protein BDF21DRAFT_421788, partial [Thamnidium elegans]